MAIDKNISLGEKLPNTIICLLTMFAGLVLILDPHFNVYGYTEMHTLGRMLGWILLTTGLKLLTKVLLKPWKRKVNILYLDCAIGGFAVLTLISSIGGLLTQRTIGLTTTVSIQDPLFWYLELAYAILAGIISILYIQKRQAIIQLIFGIDTQ